MKRNHKKKIHHADINQTKARVAILISGKIDFKENYQIQRVINWSIHQQDIGMLNVYTSNN